MSHSEAKVAGRKVLILYKLLIRLVNLRENVLSERRSYSVYVSCAQYKHRCVP